MHQRADGLGVATKALGRTVLLASLLKQARCPGIRDTENRFSVSRTGTLRGFSVRILGTLRLSVSVPETGTLRILSVPVLLTLRAGQCPGIRDTEEGPFRRQARDLVLRRGVLLARKSALQGPLVEKLLDNGVELGAADLGAPQDLG
ncbi:hypothetical protein [Streptomyces lonarensis]|uniref:hypothetical protein n=1 Tax=Streptomyces lonarensis TaxID=700599 RepID=UPI00143A304C|nr:hypothetical protein [Streptomyces lonarensis]